MGGMATGRGAALDFAHIRSRPVRPAATGHPRERRKVRARCSSIYRTTATCSGFGTCYREGRRESGYRSGADPARVAILATLARAEHEVCVCDFTSGLDLNQSTISHHLKLLKDAGLVNSVRRGTWGYYSLTSDAYARLDRALQTVLPTKVLA